MIELEGERIKIREMGMDDGEEIIRLRSHDYVLDGLFISETLTLEQQNQFIKNTREKSDDYPLVITLKNNEIIGTIRLLNIDQNNHRAELGNVIIGKKEALHQGYAREASVLILQFGFNELNLNRIELEVLSANKDAIKLYESLGFQHEGILRQYVFKNGQYRDVVVMSLLKNEFTL